MTDEQTIVAEVLAFVLENLRTYTTQGEGAPFVVTVPG